VRLEEAASFLGLPLWIWQVANLALFFALLAYFVARPLAQAFRKRQEEVAARGREAERLRAEATRLGAEIHDRLSRLDRELSEVLARGSAEGETERAALVARADGEAERVKRDSIEEIERRLSAAHDALRQAAADLVAQSAREIVAREITEDDRRRLLEEGVARLEATR
jgi:F-type H+-transporting ATPase subunit b